MWGRGQQNITKFVQSLLCWVHKRSNYKVVDWKFASGLGGAAVIPA
jgi:hypothetical protein